MDAIEKAKQDLNETLLRHIVVSMVFSLVIRGSSDFALRFSSKENVIKDAVQSATEIEEGLKLFKQAMEFISIGKPQLSLAHILGIFQGASVIFSNGADKSFSSMPNSVVDDDISRKLTFIYAFLNEVMNDMFICPKPIRRIKISTFDPEKLAEKCNMENVTEVFWRKTNEMFEELAKIA